MFNFERVIFNISCTQQSSREAIRGIKWNGEPGGGEQREHGGGGVRIEKGEERHRDQGGGGLVQWQQPPELDHQGAVSEMQNHFLHLTRT